MSYSYTCIVNITIANFIKRRVVAFYPINSYLLPIYPIPTSNFNWGKDEVNRLTSIHGDLQ